VTGPNARRVTSCCAPDNVGKRVQTPRSPLKAQRRQPTPRQSAAREAAIVLALTQADNGARYLEQELALNNVAGSWSPGTSTTIAPTQAAFAAVLTRASIASQAYRAADLDGVDGLQLQFEVSINAAVDCAARPNSQGELALLVALARDLQGQLAAAVQFLDLVDFA